jgi:hypothetical protein
LKRQPFADQADDAPVADAVFPDALSVVSANRRPSISSALPSSAANPAGAVSFSSEGPGALLPSAVRFVELETETVENDYHLLFGTRPLPRFPGHGPSIDALRRLAHGISGFRVAAFDVIASGDEDVVTSERAQAIRDQTGAVCVAWEGSGAARAALFNGIGSLEIRAVTDAADKEAPQRFDANLPIAMANLATLLRLWLG